MNGTNINYRMYVSGGTGTAEACLVVGGTGVSGATSGQIVIQCTYAHSGAWTISSAAGGVPEAVWANGGNGKSVDVLIPAPNDGTNGIYVHAAISIPYWGGASVRLRGPGRFGYVLQRASDYPAGDLIVYDGNNLVGDTAYPGGSTSLTVRDMQIRNGETTFNNTSGAAIHIKHAIYPHHSVEGVLIDNGRTGIWVDDSSNVTIRDSWTYQEGTYAAAGYTSVAGLLLAGTVRPPAGIQVSDCVFFSADISQVGSMGAGVWITGADGIQISNSFSNGQSAVMIEGAAGRTIGGVYLDGMILDTNGYNGVAILGATAAGLFNNIRVANSHIAGMVAGSGIVIDPSTNADRVQIVGNNIVNSNLYGIVVGGTGAKTSIELANNTIENANIHDQAGVGAIDVSVGGVTVIGNTLVDTGPGHAKYGLYVSAAISGLTGGLNDFTAAEVAPISITSGSTNVVLGADRGVKNVIPTVASGASVAVPPYPAAKVTGTNQITTLTDGQAGQTVELIFIDAAPGGLGTGGNIRKAAFPAQNQSVWLTFDGTNWYPSGPQAVNLAQLPLTNRGDLLLATGATPVLGSLAKGTQYQTLQGGATEPGYDAVHLDQATAVTGVLPAANVGLAFNPAGVAQAGARVVFGSCTLGTDCAVTFSAPFTSNTSYRCVATDQTSAAATKAVNTSNSQVTFTGTGVDSLGFICVGN